MQKQKTPENVRGYRIKCVNYVKCPLCYGCRNYNDYDPECIKCKDFDKKVNLCNIKLHRNDLVSKMVTNSTLDMHNKKVEFKSFDQQ